MSARPDGQPDTEYVLDPADDDAEDLLDEKTEEEEKPDPVKLQNQLNEERRAREHESTLRQKAEEQAGFWYEQATKKLDELPNQRKVQPDDDDDLISDEEYGEVLTDKKKLIGLVKKVADKVAVSRASQIVNTRTTEITALEQHFQRLPDLRDVNSEIAQRTALVAKTMKADPKYRSWSDYQIAERAIEQAEVQLLREGKLSYVPDEEEETKPKKTEEERRAAIAAQSGSKGRKAAPKPTSVNIPADQLALMEKHARGFGIPLEKIVKNIPNVVKFRG